MIVGIYKEGIEVLKNADIQYVYIDSYIYGVTNQIELGVIEHLINDGLLIVGEKYTLITKFATEIEVILSEADPLRTRIVDINHTAYVFMNEVLYKLYHSLYPPSQTAFGVSLESHIIGSANQLKIALMELRKKGIINITDPLFTIKQVHILEYKSVEPQYISVIDYKYEIQGVSKRKNYIAIEANGTVSSTLKGHNQPMYMATATKSDIDGLNAKIEPKYIILSSDENLNISLGSTVGLNNLIYCVMEKQSFYYKNRVKVKFILGVQDEN